MTAWLHHLLHLPAPVVLVLVGVLVFGEAAVFLGFVLPGETAVLLAGFLASTGRLSVVLLAVVVVACAVVGDSVGYEVGKRFGPRLLETRVFRRYRRRIEKARAFVERHGAPGVFIGRFTAFLRAVTPGLAGLSGMPYRRFLVWNAAGGVVWGIGCVVAGYLAGSSYATVASGLGQGGAIAAAALVVTGLVGWAVARHRREKRTEAGTEKRTETGPETGTEPVAHEG